MLCRTVLMLLMSCAAAEGTGPAGLLSRVSGNVEIVRAGEKTRHPARTADLILPGDRVLTGRQSEATFLFCPESREAKILEQGEVQFDVDTLRVRKGKLSEERKLPSCAFPIGLSLSPASQLQSGGIRLRGSDLILLSPSRTNTATIEPHFRWEPVDGAQAYDLKLMDPEERILWSQNTSSTGAQYPSSAPALSWGQKYRWRVSARDGDDTLAEVGSYFEVLPKEQADGVHSVEESLQRMMKENGRQRSAVSPGLPLRRERHAGRSRPDLRRAGTEGGAAGVGSGPPERAQEQARLE